MFDDGNNDQDERAPTDEHGGIRLVVGTDEAGYGPNLGPLVIGCSSWQVIDNHQANPLTTPAAQSSDLFELLTTAVSPDPRSNDTRVCITDSKKLYRPGDLARLEANVLAVLYSLQGRFPSNYAELWEMLVDPADLAIARQTSWLADLQLNANQTAGSVELDSPTPSPFPTYSERDRSVANSVAESVPNALLAPMPFPTTVDIDSIKPMAERFLQTCQTAAAHLVDFRCRVILPESYNCDLERWGNKASLLSHASLNLVRHSLWKNRATDIEVICDKHGGRNHYAGIVQQYLCDHLVTVEEESRSESRYRFRFQNHPDSDHPDSDHPSTIRFVAKGESSLPVAFSSMVAKYLRELAMGAWNRFWQRYLPDLKPTQGYPVDAKRFIAEIEDQRERLLMPIQTIWRVK